ncbi:ComF family protein [Sutcliffiella horikoshii]|uniref:ComF family protein n=1 Tax=Sutcliffiella horikoshii TaxID=79883 RepID=UPI001F47A9F7|nr:ComF family protein [Sutcliffiella horikoshii]MCG1021577.1 ComF family protein [Sutcliffiella horikoshii]
MSNCLVCQGEVASSFGWDEFLGISKAEQVCESCEQAFQKISGKLCRICGRVWDEVPVENRHGDICFDCHRWESDDETAGMLKMNRSVFTYNDHMKEVLAQYKFRGDAILVDAFYKDFRQMYEKYFKKDSWMLVPIPLGTGRLYERGFNQSLLLAKLIAPIGFPELLAKTDSVKQSKKARQERLHQENPFYVIEPQKVRGKSILLIDDIYTTGTTIRMAAKILKEAGAGDISSLTLVRS